MNWEVFSWRPAEVQTKVEKIMDTSPPLSNRGIQCRSSEDERLRFIYGGRAHIAGPPRGITLLHLKEAGLGKVIPEQVVFGVSKWGGAEKNLVATANREGDVVSTSINAFDGGLCSSL